MNRLLLSTLLSIASVCANISYAYGEAGSNSTINAELMLTIQNKSSVDLKSARVKVEATNDWIDIDGGLEKNQAKRINIGGALNSIPGLLQIQQPNGQWMNGVFTKNELDSEITIDVVDSFDKNSSDVFLDPLLNDTWTALSLERSTRDGATPHRTGFYRMLEGHKKESWTSDCTAGGDIRSGNYFLTCHINSKPLITYCGKVIFTYGGPVPFLKSFQGSFASDLSPTKLVELSEFEWQYNSMFYAMTMQTRDVTFGAPTDAARAVEGKLNGKYTTKVLDPCQK